MRRFVVCACLLFVLGCGESEADKEIRLEAERIWEESEMVQKIRMDEIDYRFFPEHRESDRMADRIADRIYERMRKDGKN